MRRGVLLCDLCLFLVLAIGLEVRGSDSRAAVVFVAYEARVAWPPCCCSFVGVVVFLDLSNASL